MVVEGRLRDADVFADDTAEITCEGAALTTFNATKTAGCGACTNTTAISTAVEELTDANNNQVYCTAKGTPFGGNDSGKIPKDAPSGPVTKCENGVNKATGKFAAALLKCHASRASGKLADFNAEENCEALALIKLTRTKTAGCNPCTADLLFLGSFVEAQVDSANSDIYCASPSGAFVQ